MSSLPTRKVEMRYDSQEAFAQASGTHRGKLHVGLQRSIHTHLHGLREGGARVFGHHIPSHKGEVGNEAADWLANWAMDKQAELEHQQAGQVPLAVSFRR